MILQVENQDSMYRTSIFNDLDGTSISLFFPSKMLIFCLKTWKAAK